MSSGFIPHLEADAVPTYITFENFCAAFSISFQSRE